MTPKVKAKFHCPESSRRKKYRTGTEGSRTVRRSMDLKADHGAARIACGREHLALSAIETLIRRQRLCEPAVVRHSAELLAFDDLNGTRLSPQFRRDVLLRSKTEHA